MIVKHWIIWVVGDPKNIKEAKDFSLKVYDKYLRNKGYEEFTKDLLSSIFPGVHNKDEMFVIAGDCDKNEIKGLEWRKDLCSSLKDKFGVNAINLELAVDGAPVLNMDSTTIIL